MIQVVAPARPVAVRRKEFSSLHVTRGFADFGLVSILHNDIIQMSMDATVREYCNWY